MHTCIHSCISLQHRFSFLYKVEVIQNCLHKHTNIHTCGNLLSILLLVGFCCYFSFFFLFCFLFVIFIKPYKQQVSFCIVLKKYSLFLLLLLFFFFFYFYQLSSLNFNKSITIQYRRTKSNLYY